MMKQITLLVLAWMLVGCSMAPAASPPSPPIAPTQTSTTEAVPTGTQIPATAVPPTETQPPTTATETLNPIFEPTQVLPVTELKAVVTAERLSCRYGPGPEYLYLYGLRQDANILLIGRTGYSNWVWVKGRNPCWLNAKYVEIQGDMNALPITYPESAKLPRSPNYDPTTVLSAERNGDEVTVKWLDIPLRAGDEEDESMLHYIVETWRCENGQLIFDPLATNDTSITFIDQPGCSQPSHGRILVQEKHGFAGPTEIPWP